MKFAQAGSKTFNSTYQPKPLLSRSPSYLNEKHRVSPVIERIADLHSANQQKQIKSQLSNKRFVNEYALRKQLFEQKMQQKQVEILNKVSQNRKAKLNLLKKQSEHSQKVLEKYQKQQRMRETGKLERANARNKHKSPQHNMNSIFSLTQQLENEKSIFKVTKSSIDLNIFYSQKYKNMEQFSKETHIRSLQKQERAENQRKILRQINLKKQNGQNQGKVFKQTKILDQINERQKALLKKSIQKLELFNTRLEELEKKQKQKQKARAEREEKSFVQARRKKQAQEMRNEQKRQKIFQKIIDTTLKSEQNRENMMQALLENKINKRLKKEEIVQMNCTRNSFDFKQKMDDVYKKDRKEWGFYTSLNYFKGRKIEKNCFQNTQISLLK